MIPYQFIITVKLGFKSLKLHKLRAALTMLGIIFGVCSVIAMLAIGEGASYEAQEAIKKLGSNNILIRSLKPPEQARAQSFGGPRGMQLKYGLTYADSARLQATIPGVVRVLPMRIIRENVRFLERCRSGVAGGRVVPRRCPIRCLPNSKSILPASRRPAAPST